MNINRIDSQLGHNATTALGVVRNCIEFGSGYTPELARNLLLPVFEILEEACREPITGVPTPNIGIAFQEFLNQLLLNGRDLDYSDPRKIESYLVTIPKFSISYT